MVSAPLMLTMKEGGNKDLISTSINYIILTCAEKAVIAGGG